MMRVSETTFVISDDANHAGYNTYRLYRSTVVYPYIEHLQNSMSYRTYVQLPGTPITMEFRESAHNMSYKSSMTWNFVKLLTVSLDYTVVDSMYCTRHDCRR